MAPIYSVIRNWYMRIEIKSVADRSREAQLRVVIIQAKNELSFNENVIMKWKTLASNVLDFDKELFNFTRSI